MPTTLPRIFVPFEKEEHMRLAFLAKAQETSLSGTVHDLVQLALELVEDLALGQLAHERLSVFDASRSLDIDEVIKWNKNRKAHRAKAHSASR
jgi:hypothetical protein